MKEEKIEHTEEEFLEEQEEKCSEEQPLKDEGKSEEEAQEKDSESDELEQLKDSYLRLRAEYDNYRKRTIKEKSELLKYGGEKVVSSFLDIMDDLDLAQGNIQKSETLEGVAEGVDLIINKFKGALKFQNVTEMEVIGEVFNPDLHEAVAMVPTDKQEDKGKIIDCVQKGYMLLDKVIRHPKVVVAQ